MAILMPLGALAAFLIFAAFGALVSAGRVISAGRTKQWSGEDLSSRESQKQYNLVRTLRTGAGVCVFLAAADGIAIYTILNYTANQ